MSNDCSGCGARLESTVFCEDCQTEVRDKMIEFAIGVETCNEYKTYQSAGKWEDLQDEAYGKTKKGESERRGTERSKPLLARPGPDTCICSEPCKTKPCVTRKKSKQGEWIGSPSWLMEQADKIVDHWSEVMSTTVEQLGR